MLKVDVLIDQPLYHVLPLPSSTLEYLETFAWMWFAVILVL